MTPSLNPRIAVGAETLLDTTTESLDSFLVDARFMPHYLARTQLSTTYYGEHPSAGRIVLKRLHRSSEVHAESIKQNIREKHNKLSPDLFVRVLHVCANDPGYVMQFVEGENGTAFLNANTTTPEQRARVIIEYAVALKHLHANRLLFGDVKWSNAMVSPEKTVLVDLDSIGTESEHNDRSFCGYYMATREFLSREQRLALSDETDMKGIVPRKSFSGELESFARMIDRLYVGTPLGIDEEGFTDPDYARNVIINKQKYPKDHAQKLPRHLRTVISRLLTYPRDDSIKLNDIITAVKLDYQM